MIFGFGCNDDDGLIAICVGECVWVGQLFPADPIDDDKETITFKNCRKTILSNFDGRWFDNEDFDFENVSVQISHIKWVVRH